MGKAIRISEGFDGLAGIALNMRWSYVNTLRRPREASGTNGMPVPLEEAQILWQ